MTRFVRPFAPCYVLMILTLIAGVASAQTESFVVERGTLVEGCGGLTGDCRDFTLRGELELTLEPLNGTAAVTVENFEFGIAGQGFAEMRASEDAIVGTVDGDVIEFTSSPDLSTEIDWTLTRTQSGLLLQGFFDQGCCDQYVLDFRNVSLASLAGRDEPVLALEGGRFGVEVRFEDFAGGQGTGKAVGQGDSSGYFWFFDEASTEVVVKMVDACDAFGRFWFFAAGLTNLEVEIKVTDLHTGAEKVYHNSMGRTFETILDVDAFATCN